MTVAGGPLRPGGRPGGPPGAGALPESAETLAERLGARCVWPAGPEVTAAVSGGADSLALLVLACRAGFQVTAVHVDHGLRPGSAGEAGVAAAAAARFGARFRSVAAQVDAGPNLEARARRARYEALPERVMTGHTADDQAETVLLNLMRGAGLDGLAGLGRAPGVTRPLLGLRRAETAGLCAAVGLRPVEDPTNADLRLRRNAVRHRLLPLLAELAERDPVPVLARQAALLAAEAAYLDTAAAALDPTDATALAGADPVLARRAVRSWLRPGGGAERHPPSAAEVERVLAVASGEVVACELAGGRRVVRSAGRLRVERAGGNAR